MKKILSLMLLCATVLFISCKDDDEPAGPVAVDGVKVDKPTLSIVVGTSETLTATIAPDNATNKNVSWKSSDETKATVDATGKVTAVAIGTATITVTTEDGAKTANCTVTVTAAPIAVTGVTLDKTTLSLGVGKDATLTATIAPADATNKAVTWSSSNEAVAKVDASGKVTAVAEGTANITVTTTDGAKTDVCAVTVSDGPKFRIYGRKNDGLVYWDGTEIKTISGFDRFKSFVSGAQISNDFYGLVSDKKTILKNGVTYTGDKVPQNDTEYYNNLYAEGTSLYVSGKNADGKATVWKDGQAVINVDLGTSSFINICVLNGDVFGYYSVFIPNPRSTTYHVYKNENEIFSTSDYSIQDMKVCGDKIYMMLSNNDNNKMHRYLYNGTTMTEDYVSTWDFDAYNYLGYSGGSMYTVIRNTAGSYELYKGTDWTAAPKSAITPIEETIKYFSIKEIGEQGDDVYEYGSYNVPIEGSFNSDKKAYYWKNSADPVRLPIDSIDCVFHIN